MAEGATKPEDQEMLTNKSSIGENQESSEKFPVESPIRNLLRETPLAKDLAKYVLGEMDFEKSPHVVERVNQAKVEEMVSKLAAFYAIPQKLVEKAMKAEVFIVKDNSLIEAHEAEIRTEMAGEIRNSRTEEEKQKMEQHIKERAQDVEGKRFQMDTGKEILAIRENSSLSRDGIAIHELLHVMSEDENSKLGGFKIRYKGRALNYLNEAATEILTLHFQYPDLDAQTLQLKIYKNEINCGNENRVEDMLAMIARTEMNGKPFTFKELAKYYFHSVPVEDAAFADAAVDEIYLRTDPKFQRSTSECLVSDLYNPYIVDNPRS